MLDSSIDDPVELYIGDRLIARANCRRWAMTAAVSASA